MVFIVVFVGYSLVIFGARIATRALIRNVWIERFVNLLLLLVPPILVAMVIFPSNSGGGLGAVLLIPLIWIAGFAAIIAGGLIDLKRRT